MFPIILLAGHRLEPLLEQVEVRIENYSHPQGLPTPLKVNSILYHLKGYPHEKFLELQDALLNGFKLHSNPPKGTHVTNVVNSKSADLNAEGVSKKMKK